MKHSKLTILFLGIIALGLVSFGVFKESVAHTISRETSVTSIDSFQILVDEYLRLSKSEKKKKEFQKLLLRLQHYTASIKHSRTVMFRNVRYNLFVADLDSDNIQLHLLNSNTGMHLSSLGAVKNLLEGQGFQPLMITNAGMYTAEENPEGLFVSENNKSFFDLDTGGARTNANFYLKPNGVFYLDKSNTPHIDTTESVQRLSPAALKQWKLATQSGPMLVINGKIHRAFIQGSKNLKIRSGVGVMPAKSKVVFAITLNESNFYDFATFFKDVFKCQNALFLDGAISRMYLNDIHPKELDGNFGPMISVCKKR